MKLWMNLGRESQAIVVTLVGIILVMAADIVGELFLAQHLQRVAFTGLALVIVGTGNFILLQKTGFFGERRPPLTPREREVLGLVAEGLTNRAIAERLVVSERTVEGQVAAIRTKLNARNREELVRIARSRH